LQNPSPINTLIFYMKKVLMVGAFDIIHPGHIQAIKEAKRLGDYLTIVIARDQNILKLKGRLPYYNEEDRLKNLQSFKIADKVILGELMDKLKVIKAERPDIIATGYDQKPALELIYGLKKLGVKIVRLTSFRSEIFKSAKLRVIFQDKEAGFLNINKPENWTSHDVVNKLRKITKIKKIGHAGTLDPFATGVLICGVGATTRMLDGFHILPKTYEATIKLGMVSDTYDRTGKIQNQKNQRTKQIKINKNQIQKILTGFLGKQKQLPPMYSAKKVQGKKLYELAREGKVVERRMSEVEIYEIKLLKYLKPKTNNQLPIIKIKVTCSTGTYIRTLAHDFGQKLGCGAVLWELKRTAVGPFILKNSVKIDKLKNNWERYILKPAEALEKINKFPI